jgi:hypothetical protein
VGKETRSLDDIFMFREFEKRLKKTPGGYFFVYPYRSEKEIKGSPVTFSYCRARERTKTMPISATRWIIHQDCQETCDARNYRPGFSEAITSLEKPKNDHTL